MTISSDSLNNDVWLAIKNAIVNGLASAGVSASVKASYNEEVVNKPIVVIPPIEKTKTGLKFGSTSGKYFINLAIVAYANNTLDIDTLSQAVENILEDDSIEGINYEGHMTTYDWQEVGDSSYHIKTISVNYSFE